MHAHARARTHARTRTHTELTYYPPPKSHPIPTPAPIMVITTGINENRSALVYYIITVKLSMFWYNVRKVADTEDSFCQH